MMECLEVSLGVNESIFSDEIKEMQKLSQKLADELSLEIGLPVAIRLKETGSFE
jgi:phenylacetate-CoA ligase